MKSNSNKSKKSKPPQVIGIPIPDNLDEAVAILDNYYSNLRAEAGRLTEEEFSKAYHHTIGLTIRNSWNLWWSEGRSGEKPAIVRLFNEAGVTFADNMSGIIIIAAYRTFSGKPVDFENLVKTFGGNKANSPGNPILD